MLIFCVSFGVIKFCVFIVNFVLLSGVVWVMLFMLLINWCKLNLLLVMLVKIKWKVLFIVGGLFNSWFGMFYEVICIGNEINSNVYVIIVGLNKFCFNLL